MLQLQEVLYGGVPQPTWTITHNFNPRGVSWCQYGNHNTRRDLWGPRKPAHGHNCRKICDILAEQHHQTASRHQKDSNWSSEDTHINYLLSNGKRGTTSEIKWPSNYRERLRIQAWPNRIFWDPWIHNCKWPHQPNIYKEEWWAQRKIKQWWHHGRKQQEQCMVIRSLGIRGS